MIAIVRALLVVTAALTAWALVWPPAAWIEIPVAITALFFAPRTIPRGEAMHGRFGRLCGGLLGVVFGGVMVMKFSGIAPVWALPTCALVFPWGAAHLETTASLSLIGQRRAVIEAWLAVGAMPAEALVRARTRAVDSLLTVACAIAPALATPANLGAGPVVLTLAPTLIAVVAVRWRMLIVEFPGGRLVDHAPAELAGAFRVDRPDPAAGARPVIYLQRPGGDGH